MRRYDDPVEVRRGMVAGPGGTQEGPEQFLWRGRLWKVCDVMAHWVETGAWWRSRGAGAVLGTETEDAAVAASVGVGGGAGAGGVAAMTVSPGASVSGPSVSGDLLAERDQAHAGTSTRASPASRACARRGERLLQPLLVAQHRRRRAAAQRLDRQLALVHVQENVALGDPALRPAAGDRVGRRRSRRGRVLSRKF